MPDLFEDLEAVATGATWLEGPCWIGDRLLVSDIPQNRILAWAEGDDAFTVAKTDVEFCNGRSRSREGRVAQCSHGLRAIEELHPDLTTTTLVDHTDGSRLNSPNDLVFARDGSIWFTDPPYGITQPAEGHPGEPEYGGCYVFRLDPAGELTAVVTDMIHPNGLAFSPDESVLYVADTGPSEDGLGHVRAYDVVEGRPSGGRRFWTGSRGLIDGFRVDVGGRLWCSDGDSVAVVSPGGDTLETLELPDVVANVCFDDHGSLYIAATGTLHRVRTTTSDAALA